MLDGTRSVLLEPELLTHGPFRHVTIGMRVLQTHCICIIFAEARAAAAAAATSIRPDRKRNACAAGKIRSGSWARADSNQHDSDIVAAAPRPSQLG